MSQTFQISPDSAALLRSNALTGMQDVFAYQNGERLDKKTLETWRQRLRIQLTDEHGQKKTYYLKTFDCPPLRRQITRWFGGHAFRSTARIEHDNAQQLAAAGITSVQPAAWGQHMRGPLEVRSFILLKEAPGESLERWLPAHGTDEPIQCRRKKIEQLADFIAKFHRAGFVHRDLYLSHIFIDAKDDRTNRARSASEGRASNVSSAALACASGSEYESFRLIDLQRVFQPRWRHRRWVVKDLAALHFSTPAECVNQKERLRFLCRYVRGSHRFGTARQLAVLIGRKARRMAKN